MTDNREQCSAIKVRTQFGVVHIHLDFDEQNRVKEVSYRANDDKITPDTQVGNFLGQVLDGINDAIDAMNKDYTSSWNLKAIAERQGL